MNPGFSRAESMHSFAVYLDCGFVWIANVQRSRSRREVAHQENCFTNPVISVNVGPSFLSYTRAEIVGPPMLEATQITWSIQHSYGPRQVRSTVMIAARSQNYTNWTSCWRNPAPMWKPLTSSL